MPSSLHFLLLPLGVSAHLQLTQLLLVSHLLHRQAALEDVHVFFLLQVLHKPSDPVFCCVFLQQNRSLNLLK